MRLVFMGTPESAVSTLRRCLQDGHDVVAVWTQPDRPAGRGNKVSASPVKEFALSRGLTVQQPSKIKTDEAAELFRSHEADVAVVVAYGRILPKAFLEAPKQGCVNVHFSLLPKYRGAAPVNWAIVNGESDTGVTTMMVEPELDSGPILLQRITPIDAKESAPEVMQRLAEMGADLLSETLRDFGKVKAREQDHAQASFAPILKKEDGLIKWSACAALIDRAIRGFQPWPNAYTAYQSRGLTVFRAEIGSATNEVVAPGQVLAARGDDLIVACGEQSTLRILELQPEARRRMGVRDFLNGVQVKVGDRLG
ncbi:MAG TPA: methionyl-tRNA formyltransferase [Pyrinomonadaceae bacterium]|jgi:methionyl-tRNA formyltransferase|nr:methionyl-tRNA formyltransferase [Pyrinomonadaceae bacterium]